MNDNDTKIVDISFCYNDNENEEFMCSGLFRLCRDDDLGSTDEDNQVMKVKYFQS